MGEERRFDVAVIGAGVVGGAVARELSRFELNLVLLEACADASMGASKANSAIVHAGYDCPPGSLMARLNVEGNQMMQALCRDLSVPYARPGSYVVAFDEEDEGKLRELYERGMANGVPGLGIIPGAELRRREPAISERVLCALHAPSAGHISPYELAIALCDNAADNGAAFMREFRVEGIGRTKNGFCLKAADGRQIESRYVVNCAGIHADEINALAGGEPFKIVPRRGEYMLLDKTAGSVLRSIIFQTPSHMGKGCLVAPTIHGNVYAGPTAEDIDDKHDTATTPRGMDEIRRLALRSVAGLPLGQVITSFAGLRAQVEGRHDFIIREEQACPGFVNAAGICSPGLTCAPAIAPMVREILQNAGLVCREKARFNPKRHKPVPFNEMTAAQRREAISANPLYGRVICRCETVTEAEILWAIHQGVGARTLDGVKHRVRAGMGRCQGGFCAPKVMDILSRELGIAMEDITKQGGGSRLLAGRVPGAEGRLE